MAGSVDMMINQYEFNNEELFEVSAGLINGDFLMSLMEELQDHDDDLVVLEESDEDRLNIVIQSLEAEINCSSTNYSDDDEQDHSSSMDSDHDNRKDQYEYSISDGEDSHESCSLMENHDNNNNNHHDHDYCSSIISFDDIDIMNNDDQWVSMEADQVLPTSSPGHELNYYMYHFGEEMMISTSTHNINNQYSSYSLDQEHSGYNSLWQETIYDDALM